MSNSLRPHESQHARPPCPLSTPGVYSNPCPSSWWCHPAISSTVVPFSSWPQSLPASGSFPMSQLFTWGGQSTGVSASASVLSVNTQDWSLLGWTGRWFQKIQTHSQDVCCHEMSNRSHTNNNAGLPVCRQYLKHFTHSCFTSSDPLPRHVNYGYPSFSKLPGVSLWGFHILHSSDTG